MSARKMREKSRIKPDRNARLKKPDGKTIKGSLVFIWLGLTGLAMLSAAAGAMLAVSLSSTPLQKQELTPEEKKVFNQDKTVSPNPLQIPKLNRTVNILVLGIKVITSDLKQNYSETDLGYQALVNSFEGLSDSMLLLRFDPEKEKLTVLSIPRDTRVYLKGYGIRKINSANYISGPALSTQAVSDLLEGVSIDRYVRINVQGVEKLIDALGGVNLYVPKDMKYTDHSQHLYIDLKEGEQHLDGNKAMQFLRFRYDRYGDIGRVQRQQMFFRALQEQALKPRTVMRLPKILSILESHIDTNLSVEELLALGNFASQTDRSDVQMLMVPGDYNGNGKNGISYWLPSYRRIREMMAEHFNVGESHSEWEVPDPAKVRIAIQDSTGDSEAVQTVVTRLQEAGYRRIYLGDRWNEPLDLTRIIAQKGDDGSAAVIRVNLGIGEVLVESTGVLGSDVTIALGEDWRELLNSSKYLSPVPKSSFSQE